MRRKISIIGAGNVGATAALYIAQRDLGDVWLIDVVEGLAQGKALDITQAGALLGFCGSVYGTTDFAALKDSDIVVVTAGLTRKPGMTREELVFKNAEIIKSCAQQVKKYAPRSMVIIVTNPLDVMAQWFMMQSGFPAQRVIGMAGALDSARMSAFVSMHLNIASRDIATMVLGGHGDAMVPVPDGSSVAGISLPDIVDNDPLFDIIERTKNGGAEIVSLLKTGSAYYAPAAGVLVMVEALVKDMNRIIPCSVFLQGEYGLRDVYIGVPVILGHEGVKKVITVFLTPEQTSALHRSAGVVRETLAKLGNV